MREAYVSELYSNVTITKNGSPYNLFFWDRVPADAQYPYVKFTDPQVTDLVREEEKCKGDANLFHKRWLLGLQVIGKFTENAGGSGPLDDITSQILQIIIPSPNTTPLDLSPDFVITDIDLNDISKPQEERKANLVYISQTLVIEHQIQEQ